MRVAVIGCGAVGLFIASALAIRGIMPTLYCLRDEDVVDIMKAEGVVHVHGVGEASAKISAAHISLLRRGYDAAIFATRLNTLEDVAKLVFRKLGDIEYVFIQPSIEVLRLALGKTGLVSLYTCVRRISGGIIEWAGRGFAIASDGIELLDYLGEGFKALGLDYARKTGLEDAAWTYLAAAASTQPVAALLGVPLARLRASKYSQSIVDQLWHEAELVAKEAGARLDKSVVDRLLSIKGCVPRMLQDIEAGIATEIDYINGVLLREALSRGVYTPYNDSVYLLIKSIEEGLGSG